MEEPAICRVGDISHLEESFVKEMNKELPKKKKILMFNFYSTVQKEKDSLTISYLNNKIIYDQREVVFVFSFLNKTLQFHRISIIKYLCPKRSRMVMWLTFKNIFFFFYDVYFYNFQSTV